MNAISEFFRNLRKSSPRLGGLALVGLGGALLGGFTLLPLYKAMHHEPEIGWFSIKASAVGFACLAIGILIAVVGEPAVRILDTTAGQSKIPAYIIGGIAAGLGFWGAFAVKMQIEALGYVFGR